MNAADFERFVQWSDEDQLFVGYCPALFFGGVCHGSDEHGVLRELSEIIADEVRENSARTARPRRSGGR